MYESESHSVVSNSLQPLGLYSQWNSPGQNTGVGGLSLLQGIFPTQGSNPGLPRCRRILYQLSHRGMWYFTVGLIYFSPRTDDTDRLSGTSLAICKSFWGECQHIFEII